MRKFWFVCFLMTFCVGLAACLVFAARPGEAPPRSPISPSEKQQLDNFKVSTLKGLRGVAVTVKVVRDKTDTLFLLKEADLQGEVELALQNAGIPVLPPSPDVGLYVVLAKVAAGGKDNLTCAMHVQSSLLQIVRLDRDPSIRTEVQTWPAFSQARFGIVSIAIAKSAVEQTVKDQVNDFANDYKTANPKTNSVQ